MTKSIMMVTDTVVRIHYKVNIYGMEAGGWGWFLDSCAQFFFLLVCFFFFYFHRFCKSFVKKKMSILFIFGRTANVFFFSPCEMPINTFLLFATTTTIQFSSSTLLFPLLFLYCQFNFTTLLLIIDIIIIIMRMQMTRLSS